MLLATWAVFAPPPAIAFQDGVFTVTDGGRPSQVAVAQKLPHDPARGTFRLEQGGLAVTFGPDGLRAGRAGKLEKVSLAAFSTSPKLLGPEQIREAAAAIQKGQRSPEPAALAGYEAVGGRLVLLMRWTDRAGAPWLEALAVLDDSGGKPKASTIGRLPGTGFARGRADDRLWQHEGRLVAPSNHEGKLGIASVRPDGSDRHFRPVGPEAGGVAWIPGAASLFATRPVAPGWFSVTEHRVEDGSAGPAHEFEGQLADLLPTGYVKVAAPGGPVAGNLATGALAPLPKNAAIAHCAHGLLVWSPADRPTSAWLYDAHFRERAAWRRPAAGP